MDYRKLFKIKTIFLLMEIKDIQPNMGKIDVTLEVVKKEEPRTFEKFGKKGKVCNAVAKDPSGQITLTLWNDDIDKVKVGDQVHIENGWCSEFKVEKQLSTVKFGKIEVGEKSEPKVLTNDPDAFQAPEEEMDEGSGSDDTEEVADGEDY